ncbi:YcbK family protein [Tianweitania sp.]|uniref:YcbK family protein n=1 Tax=Tianweitania sp. TaxID=2021634 RepID=UPI00289F5942|nr:YcbK family protein [Tianweitania sp.]
MARTNSLAGEQDAYIQSTAPAPAPKPASTPVATAQSQDEAMPSTVAFAGEETSLSRSAIAGFAQTNDGVPSLASATLTVPAAKPKPVVQEQTKVVEVPAEQAPAAEPAAQTVAVAASTVAAAPSSPAIENRVGSAHGTSPAVPARPVVMASAQPTDEKRGFLSGFFSANQSGNAPAPIREAARAPMIAQKELTSRTAQAKTEPKVQLASISPAESTGSVRNDSGSSLPGVRTSALFEITRKSGINDDSDVDVHEGDESPVRVASAAGMARLAPNGLLKQTADVDTACLKPSLVRVLKSVEQHYGKKAVITSGYRDPSRNQRARGARNSLHMYCAAADVKIEGVSKFELASYVRSMPGRGGVGTYCHTDAVHIDVGPERDWNWRCSRRK